jgi:hypothetical protein
MKTVRMTIQLKGKQLIVQQNKIVVRETAVKALPRRQVVLRREEFNRDEERTGPNAYAPFGAGR